MLTWTAGKTSGSHGVYLGVMPNPVVTQYHIWVNTKNDADTVDGSEIRLTSWGW